MQTLEELCQVQVLGGNIIRPKVAYLPSDHQTYTVDGKKVAGASTIAGRDPDGKQTLIGWANKMGLKGVDTNAFLKHSANIGIMAHKNVECKLSGMTETRIGEVIDGKYYTHENYDLYLDYSAICYNKYLGWSNDYPSFKVIATELPLTDNTYKYGGTIDIYGQLGDKKVLIDIKTSNSVYKSHLLQVAGYEQLLIANGYDVDEVYILQISRDPEKPYHFERVGGRVQLFKMFDTLIDGYHAHKEWISHKKTKVYKEDQSLHDAWIENLRRA